MHSTQLDIISRLVDLHKAFDAVVHHIKKYLKKLLTKADHNSTFTVNIQHMNMCIIIIRIIFCKNEKHYYVEL